jgi:hypothetical protein
MRRLTNVLTLLAALLTALVASAAPASAKGPGFDDRLPVAGSVSISGPGLARAIDIRWHGGCLIYCQQMTEPDDFVLVATGAGLYGYRGRVVQTSPPRGELGPAYDVRFTVRYRSGKIDHVRMRMHPYGPGSLPPYITTQPWFETPPGQQAFSTDIPAGWFGGSPTLLPELQRLGLPSRAEAVRAAADTGSGVPAAGVVGGVAGFVLLILLGALGGRPRRRTT